MRAAGTGVWVPMTVDKLCRPPNPPPPTTPCGGAERGHRDVSGRIQKSGNKPSLCQLSHKASKMDPPREMPSHLKEAGGLQPRLDFIGGIQELEEEESGCVCMCVCVCLGWGELQELGKREPQRQVGVVAVIRGWERMLLLQTS